MKKFRKIIYLTPIVMLFLGFLYVTPPITAPSVLVTPIGETITALPNTNFSLSFKMVFNESADGYFSITFYWDNNETAPEPEKWNFTYQDFVCKFTDDTPFSGSIDVSFKKEVPYGYPAGYYRYTVTISETYGESHNGDFWVNVTMRNAGYNGTHYMLHASGDQNVTISSVRCYELSQIASTGVCTIRTVAHDVAIIDIRPLGLPGFNASIPGCDAAYAKWHPDWPYGFYIEVFVENKGDFPETVVVSLYNDSDLIGAHTIDLDAHASSTEQFPWTPFQNLTYPTPMKGYLWPYPTRPNIKANVTVVAGDVNATNNELVFGTLTIRYPGDAGKVTKVGDQWIYTPADGKVGSDDLFVFGKWGWGSDRTGSPIARAKYEALGFWCDFDHDGKVLTKDLQILGKTWGDSPKDGTY